MYRYNIYLDMFLTPTPVGVIEQGQEAKGQGRQVDQGREGAIYIDMYTSIYYIGLHIYIYIPICIFIYVYIYTVYG